MHLKIAGALLALVVAMSGCASAEGAAPAAAPAVDTGASTAAPRPVAVTFVATATATAAAIAAATAAPTATPPPALSFAQLTQDGCCVQPFFSPDGARVLFLDRPAPDAPVGIWGVPLDPPLAPPELVTERLGPFSRDMSLAASLLNNRTTVERLADGQRWTINNGGRSVSFSPDAQRLVWTVQDEAGGFDVRRSELWLANVDGSEARRVAARFGGGALAWLPDSQRLLIGGKANRNDPSATLGILDLESGEIRDLVAVERLRSPALSPDGRWLAYYVGQARDASQEGVYVLDLESPDPQPRRLDFFGAYRWRDDSRLLYVPLQPGAPSNELWQLDVVSGAAERLIEAGADSPFKIANGDWDVARDGSRIVFLSARDRSIWVANLPR